MFKDRLTIQNNSYQLKVAGFKKTAFYRTVRYYLKERISKKEILLSKKKFQITPLPIEHYLDTLDEILLKKLSIARFGTGELECIISKGKYGWTGYQKFSVSLALELKEVLTSELDNMLVAILPNPPGFIRVFNSPSKFLNDIEYIYYKYRKTIYDLISFERTYADSTLFLFHHRIHEFRFSSESYIANIKKIWSGRDVVFIFGSKANFNIDSDLFDNISSSQSLIIPNMNAYEKIDDIFYDCIKINKNKLFIISGGPFATVLVYRLSKLNYQALDVGHITKRFEEFQLDTKC